MVAGNLDDVPSLIAAFQGAHAIFSVTDFWTGFRNPENKSKLAPGQTMMEWAHGYELQQGKNVFTAAAQTHTLDADAHLLANSIAPRQFGRWTACTWSVRVRDRVHIYPFYSFYLFKIN